MTKPNEPRIVRSLFNHESRICVLGFLALTTVALAGAGGSDPGIPRNRKDPTNLGGANGTGMTDNQGAETSTVADVFDCNDNNVCTDDSVSPSNECVHTNNTKPCDDGLYCNGVDACSNGTCSIHTGNPCPGPDGDGNCAESCNEASDACTAADPNGSVCNDGLYCNGADVCSSGTCSVHLGNPCPSDTCPCDESTDSCCPRLGTTVLSFKAVKKNNQPITPGRCDQTLNPPRCATGNVGKLCALDAECHVGTDNLRVLPNDVIEVEFFLSNWGPELPAGIKTFQVKLDANSLLSPDNGIALPVGWCAPSRSSKCTDSSMCPPAYPICDPLQGCRCAAHHPSLGAFTTRSRTDYLLYGVDGIFALDLSALDFRYVGLNLDPFGVEDPGIPAYLGSVIVTVSANACGTFTIGSVQDINWTYILDPAAVPLIIAPALQPLFLTVSDCPRQLLACSPEHCTLDARIAHDPLDFQTKLNTDTIELFLTRPTADMSPADFEVTLVPSLPEDIVPAVLSVTPVLDDPNSATILLDQPIAQTRWTCIRDKGSNKRCCIGSLPGDADGVQVDADGLPDDEGLFHSEAADVVEMFNNLGGFLLTPLALEKCDTDRSGRCLPADLLMLIDLLTGADAVPDPGVNGDSLEKCPAMRLPP